MALAPRLLIVSNAHLYCQCLVKLLTEDGPLTPVGFVLDAVQALEHINSQPAPQVMLVDWRLRNGAALDLAKWISAKKKPTRILFFDLENDIEGEWARSRTAGANYVLEKESLGDLRSRLEHLISEPVDHPCADSNGSPAVHDLRPPNGESSQLLDPDVLSTREQQILHLLDEGLSNKEIAKRLFLSPHTVRNHIHNLLTKLDVESRHQAAKTLRNRRQAGSD